MGASAHGTNLVAASTSTTIEAQSSLESTNSVRELETGEGQG